MNQLDRHDVLLLAELQRDSRQPVQQLAAAVGLSATPAWKRVKEMESAGIIRGYTAMVDREKGDSIQGVTDSLNRIIGITVPPIPFIWQEGGTVVVPGHGLISHEADVVDYRDMVTIVRDRIRSWIGKGMTLEQIRKADPVKGFRGRYGSNKGPWTTDQFIEAVYQDLGGK